MTGQQKLRTQWTKEPDEEPDYSDWKITLAIKKGDDPCDPAMPLARSCSQIDRKEHPLSSLSSSPLSSSSVTFSVHRNILGPQSEYFNRIFKSNDGGFSEAQHQHSHIDFPSSISVKSFGVIVKSFEALLNYCYLENIDFKEASPVPLLYFCDYFQMVDDFENKVEEFSLKYFEEITSGNKLHLLYEQIIEFRTAGLNVERAQTITAESCFNDEHCILSEGGPMAIIADLPLWLNIVFIIQERAYCTKRNGKRLWTVKVIKNVSKYFSTSIAFFLEKNTDNTTGTSIDSTSFQKLTDEEVIPYVDANAALVLLKEEQKYATLDVHISDNDDEDEDNKETESPALTDLQNRCLESLVDAQLEHSSNTELRGRAMKVMVLLPNRVMGMYLNKTLNSYGEEKVLREQLFKKVEELAQEKTRERYEHDAKRRKIEQVSSVLRNVEKELETEKEKYRLLVAERVNNRTLNLYVPPSAQDHSLFRGSQIMQSRSYK